MYSSLLRVIRNCLLTTSLLVGASAAATCVGQVLRTFDFQGLGLSPTGDRTYATAISDDGRVIVGVGSRHNTFEQALRWTTGTGWERVLPTDVGGHQCNDVSADGSVIVGYDAQSGQAFRWTESTGTTALLGSLPGGNGASAATAVSRDGNIVVGSAWNVLQGIYQGFHWDGQMNPLEISPQGGHQWAEDVTVASNGDVWSIGRTPYDSYQSPVWKNDELFNNYTGGWGARGDAITYTEEGVVATSSFSPLHDVWNAYRMSKLNASGHFDEQKLLATPADGGFQNRTKDVSTNGRLIVGQSRTHATDWAVVWEESGQSLWGPFENASQEQIGSRKVKDILLDGLSSQRQSETNIANWQLTSANGVTMFRDGGKVKSIIVGDGINPAGSVEAWRAEVNVQNPTVYVDVEPKSTYLRTADEQAPLPVDAQAIPLETVLGVPIVAGDLLYLQRVGDFKFVIGEPAGFEGPHGNWTLRNLWGVFSSSDELLTDDPMKPAPEFPVSRVPGALPRPPGTESPDSADDPIANGNQLQPTDIPEDFIIDMEGDLLDPTGVYVRVPERATHLFVGAGDVQWFDNSLTQDIGKFGLNITLVTEIANGDYNGDSIVDAADYAAWRKTGIGGRHGYHVWRSHFGQTVGGSSSFVEITAVVPEPSACVLLCTGLVVLTGIFRRWHNAP